MSKVRELAQNTNEAYISFLEKGSTQIKNDILFTIAKQLENQQSFLLTENQKDLDAGVKAGLSKAFLDRLALNEKRMKGMVNACNEVASLNDPVGRIYDMIMRPEGIKVGRMRAPIGVIAIIYEARPNVTIEAAALCLKSGNAVILRGGTNAFQTNMALVKILKDSLAAHDINGYLISYLESKDRSSVDELLLQDDLIHLVIPRGGEGLIQRVVEKSRIPVLKHYKGVCTVYVHNKADQDMALNIAVNAKVQRPAVCNSMENLIVDEKIASTFLPKVLTTLQEKGVEIRGCEKTISIYHKDVKPASEDDWYEEFLDMVLAVKVTSGLGEAVRFINTYGSGHTDSIVTNDIHTANYFMNNVDSASVMVNASTRLSDGGVYGLGAEIGISTDRLHARGPMGLDDLTTYKWIVLGQGHIRE